MNNTVMILGGSEEFLKLVQLAQSRGITAIVCDGRDNSPAKALADLSYDIPVTDIDQIAGVCRKHQVDGILTGFSDLLLECMVKIAAAANLPCYLMPEQLPYYRDKGVMKDTLRELGIETSQHVLVKAGDDVLETTRGLRMPVVVKPVNLYGSRDIRVLFDFDQLQEHLDYVFSDSTKGEVLVEEYNDGYEFNLMSWVQDGQVYLLGIADREKTEREAGEVPYSCRNVYPSRLLPSVENEALDILQRYVERTGQTEGELSMQFFWKPGCRISVCELAARFLGYEHELIEYAGGTCIEDLLLDSIYDRDALVELLEANRRKLTRHAAVLYFHGKNGGVVGSLDGLRKIEDMPCVRDLWLFYQEGETVRPFAQPYFARCTMTAETRQVLDQQTMDVYQLAHVVNTQDGSELLYQNAMTSYREV